MKIIIVGAGQVGSSLAESLVREGNDITIIDKRFAPLKSLQSKLDLRVVLGIGSWPDVLEQAGAESADMLIAVTDNDETNIVACQVAYTLYQTPYKIARIRAVSYLEHRSLFNQNHIPIDFCISPENLVTEMITNLVKHPGALQILSFAKGKIYLAVAHASFGGQFVGRTLKELNENFSPDTLKVVMIYRGNHRIELTNDLIIENQDEIFFIAPENYVLPIMSALKKPLPPSYRIFIAGGGNIGLRIAQALENDHQIKIIEHNQKRIQVLADSLTEATVLFGDASDRDLLLSENIEHADSFCAVTNDDEANIMSALLAKRLGVRQVIALVTRTAYIDLIEGGSIDIAISPQQITIGSILTHLRRGDVVNLYSLRRGDMEALELIVHGDDKTSNVIGKKVSEINLPPDALIVGIVRSDECILDFTNTTIEKADHVILLIGDKKQIRDVEKLFQVSVSFFE